jgi:hypothetical protein
VLVTGVRSFRGSAAFCSKAVFSFAYMDATPGRVEQFRSLQRSCATSSDVMNLGAWLVVLGALAVVVAVVMLTLSRMNRRPALDALAV